jgi:superfamily II DNA or RNA helicase
MSLATVFSGSFPAKLRKRGTQYWRDGLVTLISWNGERVKAVVSGSEEYQVTLRRDEKLLWASCSCPYSGDRGELCKHVWATLLAADAEGGLRGPRGGLPRDIFVNSSGVVDEEDDEEAAVDEASPEGSPDSSPTATPQMPQMPQTMAWRKILEPFVRGGQPPVVQQEEILYVINLPASVHRHGLILELHTSRRTLDGSSGDPRPLRITRGQIPQRRDPRDRAILSLLFGAMGTVQGQSWSNWTQSRDQELSSQPWVPNELAQEIARRLCATGRCHLRRHAQIDERPLIWDDGPPWELWLTVRETDDGGCEMVPELRSGDRRQDAREMALLGEAGLTISEDRVVPIELGGAAAWLPLLRRAGSLRVPPEEREDFLEMLLAAPVLPRLDLPESIRVDEVTLPPQPRVRLLAPTSPRSGEWPQARVSYLYDGLEVDADAGRRGMYQKAERRILLRDQEAESRALARLTALGIRTGTTNAGDPTLRIAPGRVPQAVRALLAEGWSVEAQGKLYRSAGRSQVRVASGIDWFELHGGVEFEGEMIDLPRLLAALRRGEDFIPLGDGSVGLLPEEWLRRWAPLAGLGQTEGDHLRFEVPQAVLLDAWLADEPEADIDETFARARERLRGFGGIVSSDAPASFRGELRPYQRLGLGWLHFLRDFGLGGCLADDMGLGKTVQVLALLESRRERRAAEGLPPSLVVVPRSLVFNWMAEAAQFTPELRVLDHTGAGRAGAAASFIDHDVVLTTYGTLRRDIALLKEKRFDYLILDEAQAIKNASSQTAKAARLLRGNHRLALTGTPVENHLGELWSLLEFLNAGFLGSSTFRGSVDLRDPDAASREVLGRALRPLILRRTKGQVATELPTRIEQTLLCDLPTRQRKLYDELRDYYRAVLDKRIDDQGLGKSKILVLEALLRLRQAACHPALLDRGHEDDPCAKLDILLPHLTEVLDEGHKALVFSQFTSFLSLLRRRLDAAGLPYLYLDGKTRNRQELVEKFQSDDGSTLFLISLKAGGLGLNLTAADYVYLLDPWWNPAVEAQAIDRAHRIGQTRPVFAYRLVARDTVEDKILELQAGKRALADAIVRADQSVMASLSQEDLELLLS